MSWSLWIFSASPTFLLFISNVVVISIEQKVPDIITKKAQNKKEWEESIFPQNTYFYHRPHYY